MSEPLIDCRDVVFRYNPDGFGLKVPQFGVMPGEAVFLQGNSGSGKSTVLNLLVGVLKPQAGSVRVLGHSLETLSSSACDRLRVDHMGFVFQQFNLLGYLSVLDNVLLPCEFSAYRKKKACQGQGSVRSAGLWLLEQLGLAGLEHQSADALSVGQQQRVAAARALIGQPEILIADEPTSALDPGNQAQLMSLILGLAQQEGCAVLCVSHDPALATQFHRKVHMDQWQFDQVGQGA